MPPPLEARPTVSGYAQNQHETLRMLRNHHAHPPTRTPVAAQMCARCWACVSLLAGDLCEGSAAVRSALNWVALGQSILRDPWTASRCSPRSSPVSSTLLPTALPGIPHAPPHCCPRCPPRSSPVSSTLLPGVLHAPPRCPPRSSPVSSTLLPGVLHAPPHRPPRCPPRSSPLSSLAFPTVLPTLLHRARIADCFPVFGVRLALVFQ